MFDSVSAALANIYLPDTSGQEMRLGSLWERNPAIVIFLRHYGCIFCRQHVAELKRHEATIHQHGAGLAAIGMGDMNYARLFREESNISFPLLVDEQRLAYRAAALKRGNLLHLLRRDNATARAAARADGHRHHTRGKDPFQLGASFVFFPDNIDRHVHINETFGDNASCEALIAALA